ncbi:MAG: CoA transferase [Desulfurococcales archaeon]|nr:CoA transferase [Desulfurococcales archaeon]
MDQYPLAGIRVIELGHIVAAPFAGMILSDLGAEVIKVEKPGGEIARNLPDQGPSIFYALNRGKKSVVIDLKSPKGREAYLRLASVSDVVVENLGPGVVDKLGVGFKEVSRVNPRIIYASIKGFGRGEHEKRPALDVVSQALSGLMRVTGIPGGEPIRVGTSIADMLAGLFSVMQILIALGRRERPVFIEAPLYDSLAVLMAYWVVYFQVYRREPVPLGSGHHVWAPYRAFRVKDGWVFIGVTSDRHWEALCKALGFEDLLSDSRFKDNWGRSKFKELLESIVAERIKDYSRDELVSILIPAGIPVAPIRGVGELVEDEYLKSRGVLRHGMDVEGNSMLYLVTPIFMEGVRIRDPGRPPLPGEHNREVLGGLLGYSDNDIAEISGGAFSAR